jgi:L-asparaginase
LLEAQAAGLRVWRTTRCASGRVLLAGPSSDPIPPVALPPAQARLALLLDLLTA